MRVVFKIPGSKSSPTAASCAGVSITACGATGTPQRTKWAFSAARSCAIATDSDAGATGRCAPKVTKAGAGTFSNSVVMAAQRCISCARPCSSK
jgi:hypothetical protein